MKITGSLWPDPRNYSPKRLFCLDLLRGLDMFYLAVFAPFLNWRVLELHRHLPSTPEWVKIFFNHNQSAFAPAATGFGLFDFGQPLFLFVCGAAVPLALPKRLTPDGRPTAAYWKHLAGRLAMLTFFACLNRDLLTFDLGRFMPQSDTMLVIAAAYLGAALSILIRNMKVRFALPFGILAAYWAIQQFGGDYTETGNINVRIDAAVFGGLGSAISWFASARTYAFLLTTLAFAAVAMFGALTVDYLKTERPAWTKARTLAVAGVLFFVAGRATVPWIPPIRQIYTLSFVLMTTGLSILCLDALYVLTDILRKRRGTGLFLLFGSFSLFTWETANFFYPAVETMAKRFSAGMPVLLGTDALQSVIIGIWEMALVTAAVICRYRMSLARPTDRG